MYLALTSASGSPGVSTTALGLALQRDPLPGWLSSTLLVEADPVGSSPTLAGFLRSEYVHDRSLVNLIGPNRFGDLRDAIRQQVMVLPDAHLSVLPGIRQAGQADAMRTVWGPLAAELSRYANHEVPQTIVVDAGRMGHAAAPMELLRHADVIGVVVRPTLPRVAALKSALTPLLRDLAEHRSRASVGLIVLGSSFPYPIRPAADTYSAAEVAKVLGLDLILTLPDVPKEARMLSDGVPLSKWNMRRAIYLRALHQAWRSIEAFAAGHQPRWLDSDLRAVPAPAVAGGAFA
ncbi:P-loop NTPase family protein [Nocardia sp. IFM 10818]